jgi:hypothetical protein
MVQILFSRILSTITHHPLIMCNVFQKKNSGKQEQKVCCPHCSTSLTIRYGKYQRAHPDKPIQVHIQRYRCKSPECPWMTFSLPPYPFLPVLRHFYNTLQLCHMLCNTKKVTQADGARRLGLSRGSFKRLSAFCRKFIPWFNREKKIAGWGLASKSDLSRSWTDFTFYFSQSFYPKRWRIIRPTQHIHINYQ